MKRRILSTILVMVLLLGCFAVTAQAREGGEYKAIVYNPAGYIPNNDNATLDYIRERFGLDLDVLPVDRTTESWNIFWAGGGYADIIVCDYRSQMTKLMAEDMIRPYDYELLVEHAPRLHELLLMCFGNEDEIARQLRIDDEVWCIPFFSSTSGASWITVIRKDWLQKVGLEVPTTIDELGELLRAFTEDDPDGNGIDDTYGANSIPYSLFNVATSFDTSEQYARWINDDGTAVITNAMSEEYRNFLRKIHEWYAAGYIDPEFITDVNDRAAVRAKFASGKLGVYCDSPWWFAKERGDIGPLQLLMATDPSVGWDDFALIGGLPDAEGNVRVTAEYGDICGQASIWFGYNCPDDAIIKCLQMTNARVPFYDGTEEDDEVQKTVAIMDKGVEGLDWEWNEETHRADVIRNTDGTYGQELGLYIFPSASKTDLEMFVGREDELVKEAYEMATSPNRIWRTFNFPGVTLQSEAKDINDMVSSYFYECKNKFITGEMSLEDDWDAYVQQLKDYGIEDLLAAYEKELGI